MDADEIMTGLLADLEAYTCWLIGQGLLNPMGIDTAELPKEFVYGYDAQEPEDEDAPA